VVADGFRGKNLKKKKNKGASGPDAGNHDYYHQASKNDSSRKTGTSVLAKKKQRKRV